MISVNGSPPDNDSLPAPLLLKVEAVADTLSVSVRSIWKMTAAGTLPSPVRLGRAVRWRRQDIEAYVEDLEN